MENNQFHKEDNSWDLCELLIPNRRLSVGIELFIFVRPALQSKDSQHSFSPADNRLNSSAYCCAFAVIWAKLTLACDASTIYLTLISKNHDLSQRLSVGMELYSQGHDVPVSHEPLILQQKSFIKLECIQEKRRNRFGADPNCTNIIPVHLSAPDG